jgi:DNA repair exonuclease SbcCD nuclease subunit
MERVRRNKVVSALLTSDWHLREDTPVCFAGDFQKEQWDAVKYISNLQEKYNCPILHSGDMYHHWKPSPYLLSQTMKYLPNKLYMVLGNHDLPQHSMELMHKCGVNVLWQAEKLTLLKSCHWGMEPDGYNCFPYPDGHGDKKVLVWHHLTYITPPYPGATGGNAESILRRYPEYSMILSGDNHTSFTVEYQGRRLVNPGNLTRQTADQIDYQPRVALWYSEDNSIEWVNLPIQEGAVSREHLVKKAERDGRIDAFVSKLNGEWKAEMSFEENLEVFMEVNKTDEEVKQIIYKSIEI